MLVRYSTVQYGTDSVYIDYTTLLYHDGRCNSPVCWEFGLLPIDGLKFSLLQIHRRISILFQMTRWLTIFIVFEKCGFFIFTQSFLLCHSLLHLFHSSRLVPQIRFSFALAARNLSLSVTCCLSASSLAIYSVLIDFYVSHRFNGWSDSILLPENCWCTELSCS